MLRHKNYHKLGLPLLYSIMLGILLFYQPYREVFDKEKVSALPIKVVDKPIIKDTTLYQIQVPYNVPLRTYFNFMDSLVCVYDTLLPYQLDEHLLVRANDWIIDTLENTDYYRRMEKGQFVYDQRDLIILEKGSILQIPSIEKAAILIGKRTMVTIDLNIPEFKLRIMEAGKTLYTFPVRVGRKEIKYLDMAKKDVDLQTISGTGKIVRIERFPAFINPVDGKRYKLTKRDDGKYTKMPLIPYLEPAINGHRYGQLIHPTTNPETLGKAYSNGCIALKEADTWRLYYYAPVGTTVVFRYDLEIEKEDGERIQLEDIYEHRQGLASVIGDFFDIEKR